MLGNMAKKSNDVDITNGIRIYKSAKQRFNNTQGRKVWNVWFWNAKTFPCGIKNKSLHLPCHIKYFTTRKILSKHTASFWHLMRLPNVINNYERNFANICRSFLAEEWGLWPGNDNTNFQFYKSLINFNESNCGYAICISQK